VLIGNAIKALFFALLEMIENGAPKPALINRQCSGVFVAAAESKTPFGSGTKKLALKCITLLGSHGRQRVTFGPAVNLCCAAI